MKVGSWVFIYLFFLYILVDSWGYFDQGMSVVIEHLSFLESVGKMLNIGLRLNVFALVIVLWCQDNLEETIIDLC